MLLRPVLGFSRRPMVSQTPSLLRPQSSREQMSVPCRCLPVQVAGSFMITCSEIPLLARLLMKLCRSVWNAVHAHPGGAVAAFARRAPRFAKG